MLQSPLVTALRHRASTDPASVMKEIEAMMKLGSNTRKNFSVSEGHQLRTLHGDLFFECTSGGTGPLTRSRKRAPVAISCLESPPLVTVPPSVAVRTAWRSVGVDVHPASSPRGPAPAIPPPSDTWPGLCHDDDDNDPPPAPPTRRQKRPRAADIPPPGPRAPVPAHNVPRAAAAEPVRIDHMDNRKGHSPAIRFRVPQS